MPRNPTELYVHPFLFQTGIRTVKDLVLTLAIHDQNVTMTKTARATFTVRTGLALPLEGSIRNKTHRYNELRSPNPHQTAAHHRSTSEHTSPFPDKGSGSQPLALPPQHTKAS